MDWLVWITSLASLGVVVMLEYRLRRIERVLDSVEKHAEVQSLMSRARVGKVTSARASTPKPPIDSQGRTTRRDTKDLPATGQMSQGIHRKKIDYESYPDDSRLHGSDGAAAASVGQPSGDETQGSNVS